MEKKTGLIVGGVFLLSLVLVVGFVMAVAEKEASAGATVLLMNF